MYSKNLIMRILFFNDELYVESFDYREFQKDCYFFKNIVEFPLNKPIQDELAVRVFIAQGKFAH